MNLKTKQFIREKGLRPGDTVVIDKSIFDSLEGFMVYLGDNLFAYRDKYGIQIPNRNQVEYWIRYFEPKRVNKYMGSIKDLNHLLFQIHTRRNVQSYFDLLSQTQAVLALEKKQNGKNNWIWGALGAGALLLIAASLFKDDD